MKFAIYRFKSTHDIEVIVKVHPEEERPNDLVPYANKVCKVLQREGIDPNDLEFITYGDHRD